MMTLAYVYGIRSSALLKYYHCSPSSGYTNQFPSIKDLEKKRMKKKNAEMPKGQIHMVTMMKRFYDS